MLKINQDDSCDGVIKILLAFYVHRMCVMHIKQMWLLSHFKLTFFNYNMETPLDRSLETQMMWQFPYIAEIFDFCILFAGGH